MSTKTDFTKDEWDLLIKAPSAAAMVVVAASPSGPIGLVQELLAVGKGILEAPAGPASGLIAEVVADIKAGARPTAPTERPHDLPQVKVQAIAICGDVAVLLDRKAPAEADGVKRWLLSIAQRTAEAAKEGAFLGIGGVRVSDAEKAALAEVAAALGTANEPPSR